MNREDDWSQGLLLATGGANITVTPPSETIALSGVPLFLAVGELHNVTVTADNLNPAHDYMVRVIYNDDKIGPDANRRGPRNIGTGIFTQNTSYTANFSLYGYATGDAKMTIGLRRIVNREYDWSQGLLMAVDEADFKVTPDYATPANFQAAATSNPGELHCTWTGPAGFDSATDQYQLRYKTETASVWSSLSTTAASRTLTQLASGVRYDVEVRVHHRDANGDTEGYSDFVSATGITSTPTNRAPIADAIGPIGTVTEGDTVSLDGTGSSDPDGDTLIYSWTQTAGLTVTLSNTASARPTFTAPAGPATLTFRLTVSDGQERTDSDTVSVSVESSTPPHTDHEDHDDHGDHTDHSDHTDRDALEARDHSDHDDHQDVTASHSDHSDRDALEAREHSDHDDHQDVTASHSDHTDRDNLSARSHSDHDDHDDLPARSHSDHLDHSDVTVSHSDHDDHNDVTASHSDHTDRDNLPARSHSDHDDHNDVSLPPSHPSGPYHSDHDDHDDLPARSHSDHLDHSDVTVSHSDHDDHNDVTASHSDHTDRDNLSARSHSDHDDHDDLSARSHSDHLDHSDVTVPHSDHNDHDDLPARDHSDHLDHQDETVPHDDYDDHDDLPARDHSDHLDHQDETVPHDDYDDHDDLPARDHSDHLDHQDETVPHDDYDDHDDHNDMA